MLNKTSKNTDKDTNKNKAKQITCLLMVDRVICRLDSAIVGGIISKILKALFSSSFMVYFTMDMEVGVFEKDSCMDSIIRFVQAPRGDLMQFISSNSVMNWWRYEVLDGILISSIISP